MLKVIGVCMILLASVGLGFQVGLDLKRRISELKYIKKIMLMLRGEIKYTKAPLAEAFRNISFRVEEPFKHFLSGLADELEELAGSTFQDIWSRHLESDFKELKLTKADKEQLRQIGDNFGYLDGEMQLGTIDLYLEQLELEIGQAEQAMPAKMRIYNCLGVMGGLFLVIIML